MVGGGREYEVNLSWRFPVFEADHLYGEALRREPLAGQLGHRLAGFEGEHPPPVIEEAPGGLPGATTDLEDL